MLVVHWSPVKNTKKILRLGITASKDSASHFFPLTGHRSVDRWWAQAFRSWRPRTQYNGFVVRLTDEDMPATFCHWIIWAINNGKDIPMFNSIKALSEEYRRTIIWRIGETFAKDDSADYTELGRQIIESDPDTYNRLRADPNWMSWVFEDYEIKVFRSIPASRIQRTLAGSNDSGRQRRREFRNRNPIDT